MVCTGEPGKELDLEDSIAVAELSCPHVVLQLRQEGAKLAAIEDDCPLGLVASGLAEQPNVDGAASLWACSLKRVNEERGLVRHVRGLRRRPITLDVG